MKRYDAVIKLLYTDGSADETTKGQACLDDNGELLNFSTKEGWNHTCHEVAPRQFKVDYIGPNGEKGKGTLHRMPHDDEFEGHWIEGTNWGMWRIRLPDFEPNDQL